MAGKTTAPPASATALSVDDILSDLASLAREQSSPQPHPLLSLGSSLLPAELQSEERGPQAGARMSAEHHDDTLPPATLAQLDQAVSQLDSQTTTSQRAALQLSSVYLDSTRQVLALNQSSRGEQGGGTSGGVFDDLHRRVAKLQSHNEAYLGRLQELRDAVAGRSE